MNGVVTVFPSKTRQPQTTRSWDFLGFNNTVKRLPDVESDMIVGVIDYGIWPESLSFSDTGIGLPPSKWKGTCQNFTCNNKLIGARFYKADGNFTLEEKSPRDINGHGTHIASIIVGREVKDASFLGLAKGTIRGAIPSARIAIYKVCYASGCDDHDILAAFDDAIADGVDIISISIVYTEPGDVDYFNDSIAVGAFHAMQKGILVSACGGNFGPGMQTLQNPAPWILTVAASTIDRKIINSVTLGNNMTIEGLAVNVFPTNSTLTPAIYDRSCSSGKLDKKSVDGKIVICGADSNASEPFKTGAQGAVMLTSFEDNVAYTYPLPATVIGNVNDASEIESYMFHTCKPTAYIHKSRDAHDTQAPSVASFSSRGPSGITPLVLKPDISAPGVDILAAFSPKGSVSNNPDDKRSVDYNIMSGTSMACPHATGAALYVKTHNPSWSPAAIKSALMTTASPIKTISSLEGEFASGAGQIDPVKAVNPGLVYDTSESDYIQMLCNINYSTKAIQTITGKNVTCSGEVKGYESFLNYPSMTAYVDSKQSFKRFFVRKVTNVGLSDSIYKATISSPQPLLNITVTPSVLSFKSLNERKDFVVDISGGVFETNLVVSASLKWSDGVHNVRSPVVVLVSVQ
ncbi:Subtilisin-like protease SBT4.3 [Thalictrum thalictroides]|uniref:Subtilisin-like protease SBT4.3 n=1 Tax=Thalictrum thalictroides TaxID=46969 RepID=A0A7J6VZG5_THATH|nr:Subtilisin-like protease SBT4.3 [Thalictrum thalictroides]